MKRRTIVLLVSLSLLVATLPLTPIAQSPLQPIEFAPVQGGYTQSGQTALPYAPNRILVKFTEGGFKLLEEARLVFDLRQGETASGANTGIATVDALSQQYAIEKVSRAFITPENRADGVKAGTDRWYTFEAAGPTDILAMVERFKDDPNIEYALPDWVAFPAAVPNDPLHPDHWGHNNTAQLLELDWGGTYQHTGPGTVGTPGFDANAHAAWDVTFGSSSIIIAILDSGVDVGHPDLNQVAGWDYGDNDSNPDDNSAAAGHGTACAGVAAAIANNGIGPAGIAGGSSIMPLKVANSAGTMYFSAIVNAIYHAADHNADIISMSFSADISSYSPMDTAIQYAINAGLVLLAATSNDNQSHIHYPANNINVIGVGAASPCGDRKRSSSLLSELNPGVEPDPNGWTCDGERWWGSNYGVNVPDAAGAVDIIAPTILPTTDIQGAGGYSSGNYSGFFNGTSCSTPYAAGVCALIKTVNPGWSPAQIRDQLVNTAIDIVNVESGAGWDRYSGYGMVDAEAAVGGSTCTPPVADFTASPLSGTEPLTVNFTDLSTGDGTAWYWNFGDGNVSTSQNPQHTYMNAGTYTVSLEVNSACGFDIETKTNYITVDPAGGGGAVGEVGIVVRNQTGAGADWYTVNTNNSYSNAVVVMKGLSTNGGHKTHLRVRNVGGSSFQWQMEEWDYHDGNHITEDCPYIVMEAGVHSLEGGATAEAGNASVGTGWATITFNASFSGTPTLLVGVASQNDGAAVVARTRNLGAGSFQVKLQEEEGADGIHATETVAWVAIDQGTGTNGGNNYHAGRTPNAVTHQNYNIGLSGFSSTPIFLCHDDTYDGGNTCSTRYRSLSSSTATVFIEEEQSADEEINHISEVVSYLAWASAGDITAAGGGGSIAQRGDEGDDIGDIETDSAVRYVYGMSQNYPNPFNPSTTIRFTLDRPEFARLDVFNVAGQRVTTLVASELGAGDHVYNWNASGQASGVYFYRLTVTGRETITKRMVLLK